MGDTFNVYVNGTEIASTVLPCSTAELAYLHFDLADSSDEIVIIPEVPWILVSPLLAGCLLAAVSVRSKKTRASKNAVRVTL